MTCNCEYCNYKRSIVAAKAETAAPKTVDEFLELLAADLAACERTIVADAEADGL